MKLTPLQGFNNSQAASNGLCALHLNKSFNGREIVRDVSLNLEKGEILGLLGPNGAGKTTCFYMITGLIEPDFGNVLIDGTDVTHLPMYVRARMGLGYLPQEASIFRGLSVIDNILAVLETTHLSKGEQINRAEELMHELNITKLRNQPAPTLSGGERRRLEIARALATNPSYILLDEPFAGVDPLAISDIRHLVKYLKERGIGVLITDHNVRETLSITDKTAIIAEGRVLFEGTSDEVLHNDDVRRYYLGKDF
jgi:lipopolysaccharide export system ATP-binding protein